MKYLVKVNVDGKVETYTSEAPDAAAAMLQAYEKYGVCGVTVSPAEPESDRNAALEEAAVLCETAELFFSAELWLHSTKQDMTANTAIELADKIRALKSAAPACPVDTAIANLDALLAERRASTMDHAQLAALGRDGSRISSKHEAVIRLAAKAIHNRGHEGDARLADSLLGVLAHLKSGEQERTA